MYVVAVLLLLCNRVVVTDVVDDLDRVREEEDVAPAQHICPRASPIVRQNEMILSLVSALAFVFFKQLQRLLYFRCNVKCDQNFS